MPVHCPPTTRAHLCPLHLASPTKKSLVFLFLHFSILVVVCRDSHSVGLGHDDRRGFGGRSPRDDGQHGAQLRVRDVGRVDAKLAQELLVRATDPNRKPATDAGRTTSEKHFVSHTRTDVRHASVPQGHRVETPCRQQWTSGVTSASPVCIYTHGMPNSSS